MNQNQKSKETASAIPHSALRTPHSAVPDLKKRTRAFALRILKLVDALPKTTAVRALASQIVRSGTSVAANYRAACRAKSPADFIAKMGIVEEEADETLFWLELLEESELVATAKLAAIKNEANELIAITVASIKTARRNRAPESAFRIPHSALR
jgi:four helix bundle protein